MITPDRLTTAIRIFYWGAGPYGSDVEGGIKAVLEAEDTKRGDALAPATEEEIKQAHDAWRNCPGTTLRSMAVALSHFLIRRRVGAAMRSPRELTDAELDDLCEAFCEGRGRDWPSWNDLGETNDAIAYRAGMRAVVAKLGRGIPAPLPSRETQPAAPSPDLAVGKPSMPDIHAQRRAAWEKLGKIAGQASSKVSWPSVASALAVVAAMEKER